MAQYGSMADRTSDSPGTESPFLKLEENKDIIVRVLDHEAVVFWSYWIDVNVGNGNKQGRSIIAAWDSPIRKYMDSLGEQHPKYRKASRRARTNVLDRTPDATTGDPLNKVKILEYGPNLDAEFKTLHGRARKRTDFNVKLDLWDFDMVLITSFKVPGDNRTKIIKPMQHLDDNPLPAELLALPRYDLQVMSQPLDNDHAQALLDGEDYMEVMKQIGRDGAYPMITS